MDTNQLTKKKQCNCIHSIYVLDRFALTPRLVGWAFVVNALWDLAVCLPCTSELYALGVSPFVGYLDSSVVIGSRLPLPRSWEDSPFRL